MVFPLYDVLIKDLPDKELTKDEKMKLVSIVPSLDQNGHDIMYTLIRIHGLKTSGSGNIFDIPYDGQKLDKLTNGKPTRDIKFNIEKLHPIASQLVYKFAMMHIEKMEDDNRLLRIE